MRRRACRNAADFPCSSNFLYHLPLCPPGRAPRAPAAPFITPRIDRPVNPTMRPPPRTFCARRRAPITFSLTPARLPPCSSLPALSPLRRFARQPPPCTHRRALMRAPTGARSHFPAHIRSHPPSRIRSSHLPLPTFRVGASPHLPF